MMYSLSQHRYFAKRDGKDTVTLTMDEVEWYLEIARQLDKRLADSMTLENDDGGVEGLSQSDNCPMCGQDWSGTL